MKLKQITGGLLIMAMTLSIASLCGKIFTTNGHTNDDVTLFVYAPKSVDLLAGTAFRNKGAELNFDNKSDPKNPMLIVNKGDTEIQLPINKNIAYVNGVPVLLDGVVLLIEGKTYVPQSAIDLLK